MDCFGHITANTMRRSQTMRGRATRSAAAALAAMVLFGQAAPSMAAKIPMPEMESEGVSGFEYTSQIKAMATKMKKGTALSGSDVDMLVNRITALSEVTPEQARALLMDPEALEALPVAFEVDPPKVSRKAKLDKGEVSGDDSGNLTSPGCPRGYLMGFSFDLEATYKNFWGAKLARMSMHKEWSTRCSTQTIYHAPPALVSGKVYGPGGAAGWSFEGISAKENYYFYWKPSIQKSGHKSWAQGRFRYCALRVGCIQSKNPKLQINGHGNDSGYYSRTH